MARIADGRRPDEDDAGGGAGFGEFRVLGQEAVAGMNGGGAGAWRDLDDLVGAQDSSRRRRRADRIGLIGEAHMERAGIGLGINRDGANAPCACAVRMTRQAISPRLAMSTEENIRVMASGSSSIS